MESGDQPRVERRNSVTTRISFQSKKHSSTTFEIDRSSAIETSSKNHPVDFHQKVPPPCDPVSKQDASSRHHVKLQKGNHTSEKDSSKLVTTSLSYSNRDLKKMRNITEVNPIPAQLPKPIETPILPTKEHFPTEEKNKPIVTSSKIASGSVRTSIVVRRRNTISSQKREVVQPQSIPNSPISETNCPPTPPPPFSPSPELDDLKIDNNQILLLKLDSFLNKNSTPPSPTQVNPKVENSITKIQALVRGRAARIKSAEYGIV